MINIVVPAFSVASGFRDTPPPIGKKIAFAEAPRSGTKTIFGIFSTPPDWTQEDVLKIPGKKPVSLHDRLLLGERWVWLVSYSDRFRPSERQYIRNLVQTTKINLQAGSSVDSINRAAMHIFEGKNPRMIIDVQLGPENVHVESQ